MRCLTYGNRHFGEAAATAWNNLAINMKKCKTDAFKKKVKRTVLFQLFLSNNLMIYLFDKRLRSRNAAIQVLYTITAITISIVVLFHFILNCK